MYKIYNAKMPMSIMIITVFKLMSFYRHQTLTFMQLVIACLDQSSRITLMSMLDM